MEGDYPVSRNFPDGLFTRSGLVCTNKIAMRPVVRTSSPFLHFAPSEIQKLIRTPSLPTPYLSARVLLYEPAAAPGRPLLGRPLALDAWPSIGFGREEDVYTVG
jgi:hypothetical protein